MKSVFELDVFKLAHEVTLRIYRLSAQWPIEERYGLTSQMRRSASSINMNLSEGSARRTGKDIRHFVTMALGSSREFSYQAMLARDLGYLDADAFNALFKDCDRIEKMLYKLHASIKSA
jgi:four helix bundle protein